ncbi:hypothetical protein [Paenibacillus turpanensis]|uniref:hypothetical protein n=1 Tax=Paenibacillus turpanensis TaxID=2689078 RepID=UPI00140E7985|nr:hypothetical protein [Paenibacillus turpanensis]
MIGSIRWNLGSGLAVAAVVFLVSIQGNPFVLSLLRSLYSFAMIFIFVFGIRYAFGTLLKAEPNSSGGDSNHGKGGSVDYVTPPDDLDVKGLYQSSESDSEQHSAEAEESDDFVPFQPPRIVRKEENVDPEELAKAIRSKLSDE